MCIRDRPRHRQAIDPPDGGTRRPYLDELAVVLFHVELFHKVRTVHAGFERLFQMPGLHQRGLLHGGHRGGFDHHVAHKRELERQLAPVSYTHLDVYKRQGHGRLRRRNQRIAAPTAGATIKKD